MRERDIEYYRQRLEQELIAASDASDDATRAIHLDLAHAYAALVSDAVSGADMIHIFPPTVKDRKALVRPIIATSTE